MDLFNNILSAVAGSIITAVIFALWQVTKAIWKKHRKLESDVVIVGQSVSLDEHGRYCVNFVLRNDAESSALITGARLVCKFKKKLELPIQAISKVVPNANYDFEISPDDGHEQYRVAMSQRVPRRDVDSFTIRIDSSSNNWICIFKIVLLINEDSMELHSEDVGIYFEDKFDGWGLDHATAHDLTNKLKKCTIIADSATSLLYRIGDHSNQKFPGWVIYIPDVTLSAFEGQGGNREDLIRDFISRQREPSVFLCVEGLEDPIEIAKCSFVKPNLVETVGHVVHNRRTGNQISPSCLFVMPRTGDKAGMLIRATSYWLVPKPTNNQPVEGVAYIELVESADNVEIPRRAYTVLDFNLYGQRFS